MADGDELTPGQRAYRKRQERERLLGQAELLREQQQAREAAAGAERVRSRQEFRRRTTRRAASTGGDVRQAAHAGLAGTGVDRAGARKLVLVSVAVLFVVNVIHEQRGGSTKVGFYRRLWGTGVVGIFLAIMADFAPQVAGPLALVITLSQIPGKGNEALTDLLGKVAPAAPTSQTGQSSGRESPGLTRGG